MYMKKGVKMEVLHEPCAVVTVDSTMLVQFM